VHYLHPQENNNNNNLKYTIMKQINLFTANLAGKELRREKSETKKSINAALANYEKTIDAEFTKVIKSDDKRARNCANAAKGKYHTALQVVANCYPYQTEKGTLLCKKADKEGVKFWQAKKLTAAAARGIVRDSLKNFTNFVGVPEITIVEIGTKVEK
jgi:hypothetical protein